MYKKLVLGQPNGYETFSTQAMEVKKLVIFLLFSSYNFDCLPEITGKFSLKIGLCVKLFFPCLKYIPWYKLLQFFF